MAESGHEAGGGTRTDGLLLTSFPLDLSLSLLPDLF